MSASTLRGRQPSGFGGWLAIFWCVSCLFVVWHVTTVTGGGGGLDVMFETPENAAIMRGVLWLKVWLWAPFLILAPLGHRLLPAVTIVTILIATTVETSVVYLFLNLEPTKSWTVITFNVVFAVIYCAYLLSSQRVNYIRVAERPVDERARRHFILLLLVAGSLSVVIFAGDMASITDRVSFLSAYQFSVFLATALLIGPIRTIRTGRTILNDYLRRDIGIWTGIIGLLHVYAGTRQSMTPVYLGAYVESARDVYEVILREQLFFWGTIIGFVILLVLLLLMTLSNDRSMHKLGKRWWKRLQRSSYVIAVLTVAHALPFQYLEGRGTAFVAFFGLVVIVVFGAQLAGLLAVMRKRRRHRRVRARRAQR
ncbi:MAG: ferric reductase-like transmembrane domain-containing protein [Gammaproteobacteria bacterium]|nr:ferric reductase-like transmembrane domain-containing protein [Gammaproteobacteria bacterium]